MIRHIRLTIPSPSDILDEFSEIVRLALRYCWHLQSLTIIVPFALTRNDQDNPLHSTIHMYANAFNILRWLPRSTHVILEGDVCEEIRNTVRQNATLAKELDDVSVSQLGQPGLLLNVSQREYAKRQHQISDRS